MCDAKDNREKEMAARNPKIESLLSRASGASPPGAAHDFFSSRFSLASRTTDVVYLETNEVNMLPYFPKPLGGPLGCLGCTLAPPFIFYQTKHGS